MFSLAQLEFIQQWLFAMGLTKEPIPLPSTDSLILPSDVVQCSPQLFNDAAALKTTIKVTLSSRASLAPLTGLIDYRQEQQALERRGDPPHAAAIQVRESAYAVD